MKRDVNSALDSRVHTGMKVGIVCGYGIIPDDRLRTYLHLVTEYVDRHQIRTLILTGGHTVKNSHKTESEVMRELMQPLLPDVELILEKHSITTLHNLLYAKQLLERLNLGVETLYIFCDYARFLKVSCLSKILYNDRPGANVIKFERKEPASLYILQIPFTILQCLGAIFPTIEKKILADRQHWIEAQG